MCGICGFTGASQGDLPILKAMCDIMAHRGPDGEGSTSTERGTGAPEAVAHRPRRRQPADGARRRRPRRPHHLAGARARRHPARGSGGRGGHRTVRHRVQREIYNYRDLRAELEAQAGRSRRTQTPKCCSRATSPGAKTSFCGCAACSRSPSGTARHASCSARGIFFGIKTVLLHGAEGERRQRGCNGGRERRGGQRNGMRGRG